MNKLIYVLLFLAVTTVTAHIPVTLECKGENEVFDECKGHCDPKCDEIKNGTYSCFMDCYPGCICAPGYIREKLHGKCIKKDQCPAKIESVEKKCPGNEHYNDCGTYCETDCQHPTPGACILICNRGCFCNEGFIRQYKNGPCIPKLFCPIIEPWKNE